eukprot:12426209-Karenia_brevis.AAC.1
MEYELDSEGDVTSGQVIVRELMFLGAAIGPILAGCAVRGKELMQLSLTGGVASVEESVVQLHLNALEKAIASKHGLHLGYALDLTTGWNLHDPKQASEAFGLREAIRPKLL